MINLSSVPHAYCAGLNHSSLRHLNGKVILFWHDLSVVFSCANQFAKPVIDYKLSRAYPQTWAAMEKLVDKGKAKLIGNTSLLNQLSELRVNTYILKNRPVKFQYSQDKASFEDCKNSTSCESGRTASVSESLPST
jgi:hypothetical protein